MRQHSEGFVFIYTRDGYELDSYGEPVHRTVYENHYGSIPKGWHVHHIDYNKKNNTSDNLIALPCEVHDYIHQTYPTTPLLDRRQTVALLATFKIVNEQYVRLAENVIELETQLKTITRMLQKAKRKLRRSRKYKELSYVEQAHLNHLQKDFT